MGRIMALDFGSKRTGVAVTDSLQIIASPLDTIVSHELFPFLKKYIPEESVERVVIGLPKRLDNTDTHATSLVEKFIIAFKKNFDIPIETIDERFTSKMAFNSMIAGGMKKKDRQNKATIDKISASIILQDYLAQQP